MIVLRKQAETNSDITLEWDAVPGVVGYRFQSAASAPKWSHTFDPSRTSIKFSKGSAWYKVEALGVEDAGEYPQVAPPPAGGGWPKWAHIWGGNSAQAMVDGDVVIASDASQGNPNQARAAGNQWLVALMHIAFDPFNADWTKRMGSAFTYGGGFRAFTGANDTLEPNPQGQIRGFNAATDNSCMAQGSMHFALHNPSTAEMIRKGAYLAWKRGKGEENGWNGMWSDNLFPGNLLQAGWAFGSCGAGISKAAWDAGLLGIATGLRSLGVPMFGGNTVYRSDNSAIRVATNVAMNETLEAQINGGPSVFASWLNEALTWHKAAPGPRHLVCMHIVPQSNAELMRFGLALTCIAGASYLPYQSHSDLYKPAEIRRNGQRHYLGKPTADPVRSGNTWSRQFEHGKVTANFDSKTGTFA